MVVSPMSIREWLWVTEGEQGVRLRRDSSMSSVPSRNSALSGSGARMAGDLLLGAFATAQRTLQGYEVMHMLGYVSMHRTTRNERLQDTEQTGTVPLLSRRRSPAWARELSARSRDTTRYVSMNGIDQCPGTITTIITGAPTGRRCGVSAAAAAPTAREWSDLGSTKNE